MTHVLRLRVVIKTETAIDAMRKVADALGAMPEVDEVRLLNPSDFNVPMGPTYPYSSDESTRPAAPSESDR